MPQVDIKRAGGDFNDLSNGLGTKQVSGFNGVKDFTIVWAADKSGSTVTYRGYLRIGKNGKDIQIANIRNPPEGGDGSGSHHDSRRTKPIHFTERGQNTFMRGRIDSAGLNAKITGTLYKGYYRSGNNSSFYEGPEGYISYETLLM